jgi:chemotaxis methyl-accepting protein methylase
LRNSEKKYYNEYTKLISDHAEGTFDVIIMCNVLHEIDTKDWLKLFRKDGLISSLLSKKGLLLLVEDQQIPTGEKAYQKGFFSF